MSSGGVALTMTGDAAKLIAEMAKVTGRLDDVQKGLRGVADTAKQARKIAEEQASAQAKAFTAITNTIAAYASFQSILSAITAEMQLQDQLNQKAVQTQVTLSSARREIVRALPGTSEADLKKIFSETQKTAKETNVDEKFIARAMSEAISASGGNVPGSQKAVKQAAMFLSDQPDAIPKFAGSLMDLSKVTGTDDARVNQGFLSYIGGLSRVNDPNLMAMNIPQALIGAKSFGATSNEAASAYAALTVGSGDIRGATSGTGLIALAQQMQEFLPGELNAVQRSAIDAAKKKSPRKLTEQDKAALELEQRSQLGLDTFGKRVEFLQGNRDMADKFLSGASFEKTVLGPITDLLLDKNSETSKQFASNLKTIPGNADLARSADQMIASFGVDPLAKQAAGEQSAASAIAQLEQVDERSNRVKNTIAVLQASGGASAATGMLDRAFLNASQGLGMEQGASEFMVSSRIRELQQMVSQSEGPLGGISKEEAEMRRKQIEILEEHLAELRGLRSDANRNQQAPPVDAHNE